MTSPGPRFGWQHAGTVQSRPHCCFRCPGVPLTEKEGRCLSPLGLRRAIDGAGRPTCCAKARSRARFPLPWLATPCPFLLPAQAGGPTPAVTHISASTVSSEKTFPGWLPSQPRRRGSRSELEPERLRPSSAPRPSVPLPVPRACLVTGGGSVSTLLWGTGWGAGGTPPGGKREAWCGFLPTVRPRGKTISFISPTTPPPFIHPRPRL